MKEQQAVILEDGLKETRTSFFLEPHHCISIGTYSSTGGISESKVLQKIIDETEINPTHYQKKLKTLTLTNRNIEKLRSIGQELAPEGRGECVNRSTVLNILLDKHIEDSAIKQNELIRKVEKENRKKEALKELDQIKDGDLFKNSCAKAKKMGVSLNVDKAIYMVDGYFNKIYNKEMAMPPLDLLHFLVIEILQQCNIDYDIKETKQKLWNFHMENHLF